MALFTLGINHRTAPLDVRERLAFHAEELRRALSDLMSSGHVHEAAILSTCNRTELYCQADTPQAAIDWLADLLIGRRPSQILSHLETGVQDGWLVKDGPGNYSFADVRKKQQWRDKLTAEEEKKLHLLISDILMRELPDDGDKADAVGHHLIHVFNDLRRCAYLAKAGDLHLEAF